MPLETEKSTPIRPIRKRRGYHELRKNSRPSSTASDLEIKIKEFCRKKNISITQFCKDVEISYSYLYRLFCSKNPKKPSRLLKKYIEGHIGRSIS